jgi:site-specific recombinase XerD
VEPSVRKNVVKRGRVFYARFTVGGIQYSRSLYTADRHQAEKAAKKLRADLILARHHHETGHTWQAAVVKWAAEFLPTQKPATAKRYLVSVRQLDPFLAERHIETITHRNVAEIISARVKQGAGNATIRRDLTALSSVLRLAVAWGWRESNPARDFDRSIIRETRTFIREPTTAEVEALIAEAAKGSVGMAALIQFAAFTGCREEEAAGLDHRALRAERGEVTFLATKTSNPRTIHLASPVDPSGQLATKVVPPPHPSSAYVFWHGSGARYANVSSRIALLIGRLVKAGKARKFRFHDLRHRFAIEWLRAGGDIYRLSRHLGHRSVKTTEIYLGYVPGGASRVVPKLVPGATVSRETKAGE